MDVTLSVVCRCGHCQRLAPIWEQLAAHFSSDPNVHISKVDCTRETGTCQQFEVKGYPTLLLFMNGVMVEKFSGSRDLESLVQFIEEVMVQEVSIINTQLPLLWLVEVLCADTRGAGSGGVKQ